MHCELILAAGLAIAGQNVPAAAPAPAETTSAANLELEYAQAKLELAKANLLRVEQMNRRLARSVPASVVADFQHDVEEANQQVQAASAPLGGEFDVWLRRAKSELQTASTRYKNALSVNRRLEGTIEAAEIERLRLRAEVARLQLERGRSLAGAPRAEQLEWQVELLNNEVDRLKEEPSHVAPFVRFQPLYWWYWY